MIKFMLPELLKERGIRPIDLVRAGMAQGTAYSVARGHVRRLDLNTLELLCRILQVEPGDLLELRNNAEK